MEKFAFLFPGQGVQYLKMGQSFYDNYDICKQTYEEASEISGIDIANLCFNSSAAELNQFTNMQIAVVTTEVAIYRAYVQDIGIKPQFVLGHSIGEFAALVAAGAVKFSDCIKMLMHRGKLVEKIIKGTQASMTIVENVESDIIKDLIDAFDLREKVFISCYNTEEQIAISGYNEDLIVLEEALFKLGASVSPILSNPPMHCPVMEKIAGEFENYLNSLTYYDFDIPMISNRLGKPFTDKTAIPKIMAQQLYAPVLFTDAMTVLERYGISATVEMGPKILITNFIKSDTKDIKTFCYGVKNDKQELLHLVDMDKNFIKDKPNFAGKCLNILASTENKSSNTESYSKIQEIYKNFKKVYLSGEILGVETQKESICTLIEALQLKCLDETEINQRLKSLLDMTNNFYRFKEYYCTV